MTIQEFYDSKEKLAIFCNCLEKLKRVIKQSKDNTEMSDIAIENIFQKNNEDGTYWTNDNNYFYQTVESYKANYETMTYGEIDFGDTRQENSAEKCETIEIKIPQLSNRVLIGTNRFQKELLINEIISVILDQKFENFEIKTSDTEMSIKIKFENGKAK